MANGIKKLNLTRLSPESKITGESSNNIEMLRSRLRQKSDVVDDKEIDTFIQFYE